MQTLDEIFCSKDQAERDTISNDPAGVILGIHFFFSSKKKT